MTGMRPTMGRTYRTLDLPKPRRPARFHVDLGDYWIVQVDLRYGVARESNPSVHRPSRPARGAARAGRARGQPALVLAPRDPGPLRVRGRHEVGEVRARPGPVPGRGAGPPARRAGRRPGLPDPARGRPREPRALHDRRPLVPEARERRGGPAVEHRLLLPGV